jgi:hypothetical protein
MLILQVDFLWSTLSQRCGAAIALRGFLFSIHDLKQRTDHTTDRPARLSAASREFGNMQATVWSVGNQPALRAFVASPAKLDIT